MVLTVAEVFILGHWLWLTKYWKNTTAQTTNDTNSLPYYLLMITIAYSKSHLIQNSNNGLLLDSLWFKMKIKHYWHSSNNYAIMRVCTQRPAVRWIEKLMSLMWLSRLRWRIKISSNIDFTTSRDRICVQCVTNGSRRGHTCATTHLHTLVNNCTVVRSVNSALQVVITSDVTWRFTANCHTNVWSVASALRRVSTWRDTCRVTQERGCSSVQFAANTSWGRTTLLNTRRDTAEMTAQVLVRSVDSYVYSLCFLALDVEAFVRCAIIPYMLSALYAIARPSLCPSVCASHGWISRKWLKLGFGNFHYTVAPSLSFFVG